MSSFKIRPSFEHWINTSKEQLEDEICAALEQEKRFIFDRVPDHIYIKINPANHHFWSPQLHLSFEQDSTDVRVRGLYGPNPTLWAVFFLGYVVIGILSLFIGMWGLVRWNLGMETSMLWIIPGLGIAALLLYLGSQAGQKLGAQQMFDIHHFYEDITKDKVIVR